MDVYAVASISGATSKVQKLRTTVYKNRDSDPTWNFPMKFIVEKVVGLQMAVVKIKKVRMFVGDMKLGEVHVPIKELMDGVKRDKKPLQSVSYQVITTSMKPQGVLIVWYELGEKFHGKPEEPVTAFSPTQVPRGSGINISGMGYGTSLLGGALIVVVVVEVVLDFFLF